MDEIDLRWKGPRFLVGLMNNWVEGQLRKALPKFGPLWRKTPTGLELRLPRVTVPDHPFKVRIFRSRDSGAWKMRVAPGRVMHWNITDTAAVIFNSVATFPVLLNNVSLEADDPPTFQVPDEWWGEILYVVGTVTKSENAQNITGATDDMTPTVYEYAADWYLEAVQDADLDWDTSVYFPVYEMPTGPTAGDAKQTWKSDITAPPVVLPNIT